MSYYKIYYGILGYKHFFTPRGMNIKYTHQPPQNSPIDMPLNEYDLK